MNGKKNPIDYIHLFVFALLNFTFLLSCNADATSLPGTTQTSTVEPITEIVSPSSTPTAAVTVSPTTAILIMPPPLPTKTPFTYSVGEGDTMLGVALRYGIELDDLKAANPEVDPNFMSIGTTLIIPFKEEDEDNPTASSTLELELPQPVCYPSGNSNLWCIVTFENPLDQTVENISANVTLFSQDQEILDSGTAHSLIRLISPGESIPIYYRFNYPDSESYLATATISSGFIAQAPLTRYYQHSIESLKTIYDDDGTTATSAVVINFEEPEVMDGFWLAAVGYDSSGNTTAFRKIRISGVPAIPSEYTIKLYSLGPIISEVNVFVEELKAINEDD